MTSGEAVRKVEEEKMRSRVMRFELRAAIAGSREGPFIVIY